MAIRGCTGNHSNEALLRKSMTTTAPSCLILIEMAEELSAKRCDMQFDSFDARFRAPLKGEDVKWSGLNKLVGHADGY